MPIRADSWVVVRNLEEILPTLDRSGELEALPFMAEMLQYCGQRLQVSAVAHKTCDTINKTGGRRVANAVHLKGVRCDGSAHGNCQAGCLIFWKTEWLRPANGRSELNRETAGSATTAIGLDQLRATGLRMEGGEVIYSCQATRLFAASSPLRWWDVRQYWADIWYGNVSAGRLLRVATLRALFHLRRLGIGYRASIALYDLAHKLITGRPSPHKEGLIPAGDPTPTDTLNLARGERVQVKSHEEICSTISRRNFNRGMRFDVEMVRFCGRSFEVDRKVERLIDERTGRMLVMKSPCIVLSGAVCASEYSDRRLFCPRQIQPYFREIWLRRAPADAHGPDRAGSSRGG